MVIVDNILRGQALREELLEEKHIRGFVSIYFEHIPGAAEAAGGGDWHQLQTLLATHRVRMTQSWPPRLAKLEGQLVPDDLAREALLVLLSLRIEGSLPQSITTPLEG